MVTAASGKVCMAQTYKMVTTITGSAVNKGTTSGTGSWRVVLQNWKPVSNALKLTCYLQVQWWLESMTQKWEILVLWSPNLLLESMVWPALWPSDLDAHWINMSCNSVWLFRMTSCEDDCFFKTYLHEVSRGEHTQCEWCECVWPARARRCGWVMSMKTCLMWVRQACLITHTGDA